LDDNETQIEQTATTVFTTNSHVPKKKKRKAKSPKRLFFKMFRRDDINEYDAIGINVSLKLKRVDPIQSIHAAALISNVVTEGY